MVTLKDHFSVYELGYDRNDNGVALKYKLAEKINKDPVNITLKDGNGVELDNNKYIPDGLKIIKISLLNTSSNDIILKVGKNQLGLPKLMQVNPEQSIRELILIMKGIAYEERELIVFKRNWERLSDDMLIKDCRLRNESVIKVFAKEHLLDKKLRFSVVNLKYPNDESRLIKFKINDSIEDIKNTICRELSNNIDLSLFTENDYLESGRNLIDYMDKKIDVIFYVELQGNDNINIGETTKKGQIATILKGNIIKPYKDIILKRYDFNEEQCIKFIKYDITTLAMSNHERLVRMETMFAKGNHFFIGLELMDKSLKGCLPVTTEDDIFRYAIQTLEGLSYLHGVKIIYRSLKCSSILLDKGKNVKLSNFHFSKHLLGGSDESRLYDATRSKPIDKNWAAPEMFEGNAYGLQADIWSYGATLIEMITKNPPYHEFNQSMIENNLLDRIKPTYKLPAECPEWVKNIIESCLNWEPLLRPKVDDLIKLIRDVPHRRQ